MALDNIVLKRNIYIIHFIVNDDIKNSLDIDSKYINHTNFLTYGISLTKDEIIKKCTIFCKVYKINILFEYHTNIKCDQTTQAINCLYFFLKKTNVEFIGFYIGIEVYACFNVEAENVQSVITSIKTLYN